MENPYLKLKLECLNQTELNGLKELFKMELALRQQVNLRAKGGGSNKGK